EMEKKQRKFDQQLAEERANVQKTAVERDAYAQESRDRETKLLSLQNDVEVLRAQFDDSERVRRMLQLELDETLSNKDDVGKSVHELEKQKRFLEQQVQDQKLQLEELEDGVQLAEDARLRLEVNLQAAKAEQDRLLAQKEIEHEEKRKSLLKQVRDLEEELEGERRGKTGAVNSRKKLESQIADLEQQLELSNRLKEDYNRQLRKCQGLVKEFQHDAEEARQAKEDMAASMREYERRCRAAEAELHTLQEQLEAITIGKRQAEAERDELLEQLGDKAGVLSSEERRRLEARIAQLEEELEEEQSNMEVALDKQRKAQLQVSFCCGAIFLYSVDLIFISDF
uniref:Myosin tail domain-containing protein n=1 Tax=Plectus sambesii TaxID=2011161 RepID=A0A914UV07_9BILA